MLQTKCTSMSTMRGRSSTSTRQRTTTAIFDLSIDDLQIERLRLAIAQSESRRAIFDLFEELRVGAFAILEVINRHSEIAIIGRQSPDAELTLLIRAPRLHEPRWERPLRRVAREPHAWV